MGGSDLHIHSIFSDGANTPEEMVQAALEKGFSAIGLSDHSFTEFDLSYCIRDFAQYSIDRQKAQRP